MYKLESGGKIKLGPHELPTRNANQDHKLKLSVNLGPKDQNKAQPFIGKLIINEDELTKPKKLERPVGKVFKIEIDHSQRNS